MLSNLVTAFGGCSEIHLNAAKYPGKISTIWEVTSSFKLDTRARVITDYLQNVRVERIEWSTNSTDLNALNPILHLWDELGHAEHARGTTQPHWLNS